MVAIKPTSTLTELLVQSHVQVYRIAIALCGGHRSAEAVVRTVLRKSVTIYPRWETDQDALRWFVRYTVLLTRTMEFDSTEDLLVRMVDDADSIATIKAIRHLPMQQREAFLLHHGEGLDLHQMAMAMDCSTVAAANHLVAAVKALKESRLIGLGDFTAHLPQLLRKLMPPADAMDLNLQRVITKQRRRNWIFKIARWVFWAMLFISMFWLVWWIIHRVEIV